VLVDLAGEILGVGVLCEAEESGDDTADNQDFLHLTVVLYHTKIVILEGNRNRMSGFGAGLIFVRKSLRKHFKP
jgi:hypothetical protein